jgi:uncharacterized integral membrane protein
VSRIGFWLVAILAIAVGLLVGTFNSDRVLLDLVWVQLTWPLGLLVLAAFAVGLVVGLVMLFLAQVLPLKLSVRRLQAASRGAEGQEQTGGND